MTDKMTPAEKQNLISTLTIALEMAKGMPSTTPCTSCLYFGTTGRCEIWNDVVPPEARGEGCEKFIYDEIPF